MKNTYVTPELITLQFKAEEMIANGFMSGTDNLIFDFGTVGDED